jgi:hypothetical protein
VLRDADHSPEDRFAASLVEINGDISPARSRKMANQTSILNDVEPTADKLTIDELATVNGGAGIMSLLTNLANMRHEMLKSIIQNLRA